MVFYIVPFYGGWFSYEKEMQKAKESEAGKAIHTISFERLKLVSFHEKANPTVTL